MIDYFNQFVRIVTFSTPVEGCQTPVPAISGTCFLLKINGSFFVVTAGHVFKDFCIRDLRVLLNPFSTCPKEAHRAIAIDGGFNFFNGSPEDPKYDADAYDFCVLHVSPEEPIEDLAPFFIDYIPPTLADFSLGNTVFVTGYPNILQDIDYESYIGNFGMVALPATINNSSYLTAHFELGTRSGIIDDFDGLSGAPVFQQKANGGWGILGFVVRGTASSGIIHCINIKMVEIAIQQRTINIANGVMPNYTGLTYNNGSSLHED